MRQGTKKSATGAAQAVALLLALASAGCGESDQPDESDTRFRECMDQGGSFTADDYNQEWSCKLPSETVTVTPTEEP